MKKKSNLDEILVRVTFEGVKPLHAPIKNENEKKNEEDVLTHKTVFKVQEITEYINEEGFLDKEYKTMFVSDPFISQFYAESTAKRVVQNQFKFLSTKPKYGGCYVMNKKVSILGVSQKSQKEVKQFLELMNSKLKTIYVYFYNTLEHGGKDVLFATWTHDTLSINEEL